MNKEAIICLPRGAGKTAELVRLAKKNNGIIVTFSAENAERIRRQFCLTDADVVSYHVFEYRRGSSGRPIYIDDADTILGHLLHTVNIAGMSVSCHEEIPQQYVPFTPADMRITPARDGKKKIVNWRRRR